MSEADSHQEAEAEKAPQQRSRWRGIGRKLAVLTGTLMLLYVGLEVWVRYYTDTIPPLTVRDARIGNRYIRSFEDEIFVPEAGHKVHLRFNRLGFRGPDRPKEKPAGVRRIAVLGDSEVAGITVEEADTMVCQLERLLNESQKEVKWEVLNFGVSGSSPGQELVLYREVVRDYDPDIVLGMFTVGNDLADNSSRLSSNPRIYFDVNEQGKLEQLPFSGERAAVSQFLNRYSRFYVWQKHAFRMATAQARTMVRQIVPGQWVYCRKENEDVAHAWKISGAVAQELNRTVTADGAKFAVVMIPSSEQIIPAFLDDVAQLTGELADKFDADYPDERLSGLCRQAGIPIVSVKDAFRAAAPSASASVQDEWLFQNGRGHCNERGNQILAEEVLHFLTQANPQVAGTPFIRR